MRPAEAKNRDNNLQERRRAFGEDEKIVYVQ